MGRVLYVLLFLLWANCILAKDTILKVAVTGVVNIKSKDEECIITKVEENLYKINLYNQYEQDIVAFVKNGESKKIYRVKSKDNRVILLENLKQKDMKLYYVLENKPKQIAVVFK